MHTPIVQCAEAKMVSFPVIDTTGLLPNGVIFEEEQPS